jgi:major membrane immunogen (membrane-anchored lipoprotein)
MSHAESQNRRRVRPVRWWRAFVLASVLLLVACGGSDSNEGASEPAAQPTTETASPPPAPKPKRNRALEAHLRKYLPLGMGSYAKQVGSIVVTDKVTIKTKTSDPNFLYRGTCQTALDLAQEHSGVSDVEVLDANGTVKSSSVGLDACEKRY